MSDAVRAMLEARSVAVVGASARPGSFGERIVDRAASQSPAVPAATWSTRGTPRCTGCRCLPVPGRRSTSPSTSCCSLSATTRWRTSSTAAARGRSRGGVRVGLVAARPRGPSLRDRLASIATGAGMALCGGGCMGFVDLTTGLRAIGYLERDVLPVGPVALVSHSGSAFSALLRSRRRIGWTSAVSSGQELVTTTADYVEHALDDPATRCGRAGPRDGARAAAAAGRPRPRPRAGRPGRPARRSADAARRRSW